MKRIAILSLVFYNYGTRLQSYALCRIINRLFKDTVSVEVLNTESSWSIKTNVVKFIVSSSIRNYKLRSFKHILEVFKYMYESNKIYTGKDHTKEIKERKDAFNNIISKIPYTNSYYSFDEIRNGLLPRYDAVLVGSDQVWNGIKVGNQDIFMLDFLKGEKGLTYAASFGMTSIPPSMLDDYKRRINNFDSLLIREQEGVDICRELGRNDSHLVLDPTLLLVSSEYEDVISEEPIIQGKYVLVYSLNYSYRIFDEAYKLSKQNNCIMVVLKRSFCPPDISRYKDAVELYAESPESFLWLIKNAKCIVTNSYHALLFSINFNKNFYLYLDNADEENSRLLTIINMVGLNSQVFWETNYLPRVIHEIDYTETNTILQEERTKSIQLLKESICKKLQLCN